MEIPFPCPPFNKYLKSNPFLFFKKEPQFWQYRVPDKFEKLHFLHFIIEISLCVNETETRSVKKKYCNTKWTVIKSPEKLILEESNLYNVSVTFQPILHSSYTNCGLPLIICVLYSKVTVPIFVPPLLQRFFVCLFLPDKAYGEIDELKNASTELYCTVTLANSLKVPIVLLSKK